MAKVTLADVLAAVDKLGDAVIATQQRMDTLEAGSATADAAPVAASPARPKLTVIKGDPELAALEGQMKPGKVKLAQKCASHSPAALRTFLLGGGRSARAFMAGQGPEVKQANEFALIPGFANHSYVMGLLEGNGSPVKAKASPTRARATRTVPKAKNGKALRADMTDAQLLKHRPAGASQNAQAVSTWLWRTREKIAGRDPMRSKA